VAEVEKFVELFCVLQFDDEVFACEGLFAVVAVCVFQVDLVKELTLCVGDKIASNAMTTEKKQKINLNLKELCQLCCEQSGILLWS